MPRTGRSALSAEQKKELWKRWKEGQSLSEIGSALDKHAGSVHGVLSASGGIAPRERKRRGGALTLLEREGISRSLATQCSMRWIAQRLGRAPSTISREINRNGGIEHYRATVAETKSWDRAQRPKPCKLAINKRLNAVVANHLSKDWSPQQISGWLARTYEADMEMQVSQETIYRSLFIQARDVLKRELISHLRSRRMMRTGKQQPRRGSPVDRSLMQSRFGSGLLTSKIVRCLAIGKVICAPEQKHSYRHPA